MQAGSKVEAADLPSVPVQRSTVLAKHPCLQPGQSVATAGPAAEGRTLVLDEYPAAIGQDRWPLGETRPVLLAIVGGESSDAAAVWKHGTADRSAAAACGVAETGPAGR